jgi:hypothetical protein
VRVRPFLLIPLLLGLGGCAWLLDDDTGDTADTGDSGDTSDTDDLGCPSGMAPRRDLDVGVRNHSFNAQNLVLTYSATATWNGDLAGCASPDGLRVRVLLLRGGQPYGWLWSEAPRLGGLSPVTDRSLTLDLFGADPPTTFGPGAWYQGLWTALQLADGTIEHAIDASARNGAQVTTVQAYVEVP